MFINKKLIIGSLLLATFFVGCGSDSDTVTAVNDIAMENNVENSTMTNTQAPERFMAMTMGEQIVMQDNTTKLEWVNGNVQNSGANHGCLPLGPGKAEIEAQEEAKAHCEALNFANHTDWRFATDSEIQEFVTELDKVNIIPFGSVDVNG